MPTRTYVLIAAALAVLCSGSAPRAESARTTRAIRHLVLVIHPFLYSAVPPPADPERDPVREMRRQEAAVVPAMFAQLATLPDDAALVLLGGAPGELRDRFTEAAKARLGDRFVEVPEGVLDPRQETFWKNQNALFTPVFAEELRRVLLYFGQLYVPNDLGNAAADISVALYIRSEFENHGYAFDPASATAEAWGESFEACARRDAGVIATYLGFRLPPNVRFDRSVSDLDIIATATLVQRRVVANTVVLYVLRLADGRYAATLVEGLYRVGNPRRAARLRFRTSAAERGVPQDNVRVVARLNGTTAVKIWPARDPEYGYIPDSVGYVDFPVGRSDQPPLYLIADGVSEANMLAMFDSITLRLR
jgi:hypothetical protein